MEQGTQDQRTDELARNIGRMRLYLEQQQQRTQEQRTDEVARNVERVRLYLEQQQRERANAAEVRRQPPAAPRFNPQGLRVEEALIFLDDVKTTYIDRPHVYEQFLDTMRDFKCQVLDTPGVMTRVTQLFNEHPRLIDGFNQFLPSGYKISV